MNKILVPVEDTDLHRRLLREAGQIAAGTGVKMILLGTVTPEEEAADFETLETVADIERTEYDHETVIAAIENEIRNIANDTITENVDIVAEVVETGDVDREDAILNIAEEHECDHIFIPAEHRTPAGKIIFGDVAQQLLLDFDGFVTVTSP
jgi:nucleotide-binding universal stress UspA family protein